MNQSTLNISDEEILSFLQSGQNVEKGFKLLMLKYQERLYWQIRRLVLEHEDANDVIQNTFIKVFRSIQKFKGDSQLYTWLYRIAINSTKNHLIAKSRRPPDVDIDVSEVTSFLQSSTGPEGEFEGERLGQIVQTAISKLPQELKVAMIMREYEGMSYEDISSIMECPIGTVRSRIFRAREAIEKEIKNVR